MTCWQVIASIFQKILGCVAIQPAKRSLLRAIVDSDDMAYTDPSVQSFTLPPWADVAEELMVRFKLRLAGSFFGAICLATWALAVCPAAEPPVAQPDSKEASEETKPGRFIRLLRTDDGELASMDTATVRYAAEDEKREGLTVDLIGAVHIGEAEYYAELNKQFEQYDALLYELVAPEGTRITKDTPKGGNPVGMLQTSMKNILELDYQLDHIDYERENFVHADMSPDDFARTMEERGESIWTMMFKMMGHAIAQQSKNPNRSSDAEILLALFNPDRALALKRILAEQFEDMEGMLDSFGGPDGSTIITERNKKALEVLKREIAAGKKRIGIFYGAGHMTDMEARLLSDFALKRGEETWLTAWDLRDNPAPDVQKPPKPQAPARPKERSKKAPVKEPVKQPAKVSKQPVKAPTGL